MNPDATNVLPHTQTRFEAAPAISEADYLNREISEAQMAIGRTVKELQGSVSTATDLGLWAKRYPWAAVGAALATGLMAARVLVPAKQHVSVAPIYAYPP